MTQRLHLMPTENQRGKMDVLRSAAQAYCEVLEELVPLRP